LFRGDDAAVLVDDVTILIAVVPDQQVDSAARPRHEGTERAVGQYLSVDHRPELRPAHC